MMKMHLYQFSDGNPENNIYLASTLTDEKQLRAAERYTDHGGMAYDVFNKVWSEGKMTEMLSLDQVPEDDWGIIPFETDEWVEELEDYFSYGNYILNFFEDGEP